MKAAKMKRSKSPFFQEKCTKILQDQGFSAV